VKEAIVSKETYVVALLAVSLGYIQGVSTWAQESTFVDEETFRLLDNHLSGDIAKDNLATLTRFHRPGGSQGFHEAAEFIIQRAQDYGLEGIRLIRQEGIQPAWTPGHSELWMLEPEEIKLADNREVATSLADHSRPADVTAELVDVGRGVTEADYEGKDVEGKLVLASGIPPLVMAEAVSKRGALGVVSSFSTRVHPLTEGFDQVSWGPAMGGLGQGEGAFAFMISPRLAQWLRKLVVGGVSQDIFNMGVAEPQKVVLRARVESKFDPEPWMEMIEYVIPGSEIHDQDIVLTAHLQEEKFSANDDGSGCVNILEIARVMKYLIDEGKMPRPRRDIRFWWATEISSEYRYFADHPEERQQFLVNINQDMVGANQSLGNRVQQITRTPYSIPSYLSDVVESIAESMILGNTAFLSVRTGGKFARGTRYSRPILSSLGTRERYNAMVVPYHGMTDHMVFVNSIIGIPGVTLTNWPDPFIHSSADDLWNVDSTQLKRNALLVTAAALYIASAGKDEAPALTSEVYGRALGRIGRDVGTAARLLQRSSGAEGMNTAYRGARNLLEQAVLREQAAVRSVSVFTPAESRENALVETMADSLGQREREWLDLLDRVYRAASGGSSPPVIELSPKGNELSKKIPRKVGTVTEYLRASQQTPPVPNLHQFMREEILNFADGKRSVLDIFNAVSAESQSVGAFYYGEVTLEAVEQYLTNAEEAGAIQFQ
jgi:hypothetical protein